MKPKSTRRPLSEMTRKNALDPRNYRNPMAGRNVSGKAGNPLVRPAKPPKNQMGAEMSRHGLVYRSLEDGQNLIESSERLIARIDAFLG